MLGHHIRYAVRALASRPGVAATAIAILTLGIGAATTIFSIVDAVMLRALPFRDPARLAVIWETSRDEGLPQMFASPPDYADWAARSRSFASMGAFSPQELTIAVAADDPEYVSGARISASLLTTLGVNPVLGRSFRDDEDGPDAARVAIVSAEWWQRRLGRDPGALGRTVTIDGVPRAIVGVLPAGAMVPPAIGLFGRPPAICQGTDFALEGESLAAAGASRHTNFSLVGPGYFRALGVPIVSGRVLDDGDRADAPPVVVINEVLARTYGGAQAALGRRVTLGMNTQSPRTIVGVVANEKNLGLDAEPGPNAYVPYLQIGGSARMTFVVRSAMDAAGSASAARDAIHAIDPTVPLFDVRTMEESMSRAMARPRLIAQLLTSFAVAALLLAAVGIFGVMSQTVAQQTREIGIRVAIGAGPGRILGLILGRAARLTAIGLLPGVAAALAAGRLASGLLFGITGTDARTFAFVAATMMAVAGLAALLPAIRAVRVDPITALHAD